MKSSKTTRNPFQNVLGDVAMDPRKSSNIQIEYNVPFSKLNPRIEKENMDSVNSNLSLQVFSSMIYYWIEKSQTLKEEEDALTRDIEKKKKAEAFFKKVQDSRINLSMGNSRSSQSSNAESNLANINEMGNIIQAHLSLFDPSQNQPATAHESLETFANEYMIHKYTMH